MLRNIECGGRFKFFLVIYLCIDILIIIITCKYVCKYVSKYVSMFVKFPWKGFEPPIPTHLDQASGSYYRCNIIPSSFSFKRLSQVLRSFVALSIKLSAASGNGNSSCSQESQTILYNDIMTIKINTRAGLYLENG